MQVLVYKFTDLTTVLLQSCQILLLFLDRTGLRKIKSTRKLKTRFYQILQEKEQDTSCYNQNLVILLVKSGKISLLFLTGLAKLPLVVKKNNNEET